MESIIRSWQEQTGMTHAPSRYIRPPPLDSQLLLDHNSDLSNPASNSATFLSVLERESNISFSESPTPGTHVREEMDRTPPWTIQSGTESVKRELLENESVDTSGKYSQTKSTLSEEILLYPTQTLHCSLHQTECEECSLSNEAMAEGGYDESIPSYTRRNTSSLSLRDTDTSTVASFDSSGAKQAFRKAAVSKLMDPMEHQFIEWEFFGMTPSTVETVPSTGPALSSPPPAPLTDVTTVRPYLPDTKDVTSKAAPIGTSSPTTSASSSSPFKQQQLREEIIDKYVALHAGIPHIARRLRNLEDWSLHTTHEGTLPAAKASATSRPRGSGERYVASTTSSTRAFGKKQEADDVATQDQMRSSAVDVSSLEEDSHSGWGNIPLGELFQKIQSLYEQLLEGVIIVLRKPVLPETTVVVCGASDTPSTILAGLGQGRGLMVTGDFVPGVRLFLSEEEEKEEEKEMPKAGKPLNVGSEGESEEKRAAWRQSVMPLLSAVVLCYLIEARGRLLVQMDRILREVEGNLPRSGMVDRNVLTKLQQWYQQIRSLSLYDQFQHALCRLSVKYGHWMPRLQSRSSASPVLSAVSSLQGSTAPKNVKESSTPFGSTSGSNYALLDPSVKNIFLYVHIVTHRRGSAGSLHPSSAPYSISLIDYPFLMGDAIAAQGRGIKSARENALVDLSSSTVMNFENISRVQHEISLDVLWQQCKALFFSPSPTLSSTVRKSTLPPPLSLGLPMEIPRSTSTIKTRRREDSVAKERTPGGTVNGPVPGRSDETSETIGRHGLIANRLKEEELSAPKNMTGRTLNHIISPDNVSALFYSPPVVVPGRNSARNSKQNDATASALNSDISFEDRSLGSTITNARKAQTGEMTTSLDNNSSKMSQFTDILPSEMTNTHAPNLRTPIKQRNGTKPGEMWYPDVDSESVVGGAGVRKGAGAHLSSIAAHSATKDHSEASSDKESPRQPPVAGFSPAPVTPTSRNFSSLLSAPISAASPVGTRAAETQHRTSPVSGRPILINKTSPTSNGRDEVESIQGAVILPAEAPAPSPPHSLLLDFSPFEITAPLFPVWAGNVPTWKTSSNLQAGATATATNLAGSATVPSVASSTSSSSTATVMTKATATVVGDGKPGKKLPPLLADPAPLPPTHPVPAGPRPARQWPLLPSRSTQRRRYSFGDATNAPPMGSTGVAATSTPAIASATATISSAASMRKGIAEEPTPSHFPPLLREAPAGQEAFTGLASTSPIARTTISPTNSRGITSTAFGTGGASSGVLMGNGGEFGRTRKVVAVSRSLRSGIFGDGRSSDSVDDADSTKVQGGRRRWSLDSEPLTGSVGRARGDRGPRGPEMQRVRDMDGGPSTATHSIAVAAARDGARRKRSPLLKEPPLLPSSASGIGSKKPPVFSRESVDGASSVRPSLQIYEDPTNSAITMHSHLYSYPSATQSSTQRVLASLESAEKSVLDGQAFSTSGSMAGSDAIGDRSGGRGIAPADASSGQPGQYTTEAQTVLRTHGLSLHAQQPHHPNQFGQPMGARKQVDAHGSTTPPSQSSSRAAPLLGQAPTAQGITVPEELMHPIQGMQAQGMQGMHGTAAFHPHQGAYMVPGHDYSSAHGHGVPMVPMRGVVSGDHNPGVFTRYMGSEGSNVGLFLPGQMRMPHYPQDAALLRTGMPMTEQQMGQHFAGQLPVMNMEPRAAPFAGYSPMFPSEMAHASRVRQHTQEANPDNNPTIRDGAPIQNPITASQYAEKMALLHDRAAWANLVSHPLSYGPPQYRWNSETDDSKTDPSSAQSSSFLPSIEAYLSQ